MQQQHPNVIAKPPRIFITFMALGFILNALFPLSIYASAYSWPVILGALLSLDGIIVLTMAMRRFKKRGTPVSTSERVSAIVSDGIYRFSRNPIYLGMFLAYFGIFLMANNAWGLILGVALYLIMHFGVILREERYLTSRFGDDYQQYLSRVRRWI